MRVKTIYISDWDDDYWKMLEEEAAKEKRSVSFLINILVREYIKGKGRQSNDSEEGGAQE